MRIVIILPTYNERDNIIKLLNLIIENSKNEELFETHILVVDDSSPDGTGELVKTYSKSHPQVHLIVGKKAGLGRALLRGMTHAVEVLGADVLVQMDADGSHNPRILPLMFQKIIEGYDFVLGSRYVPGGSIPSNWGFDRKLFSVMGNLLVRYGLGVAKIRDWTGGYRAYRSKYFEYSRDSMSNYSGYVFQIAFLHKSLKAGAKVFEVPIQFTDRIFGVSKIASGEYIRNVLFYILNSRIQELLYGTPGKFAVVGVIGLTINTILLELLVKIGMHPAVGSAVGAECAIISNFFLNNAWTFKDRKHQGLRVVKQLFKFNLTSLGALIIQSSTVFIGTHLISVAAYRPSYFIGVGIGMIWNYVMYSRVIWKKNNTHG